MINKTYISNSSRQTESLAEKLAKRLKGGQVVALFGDLGAGKTTFVKGLGKGLGVKERIISPTFIIQNSHNLRKGLIFNHFDFYRLDPIDDLTIKSVEEIFSLPYAISAIEWSERIEKFLPKKTIKVKFENLGEDKRRIEIYG